MAILVTNQSHFNPMSFEEILRPYQIMTEEYNKREAEISALDTKAETMRQYADNEIRNSLQAANKEVNETNINQWIKDNPNSFATKYMNYASSLDKAAEDLATKGLKGTNRKAIYDLTNQYQTNVVPIETALKTRTAKSDEQRKAHLANPNLRFDRDFSTIGLQELIDNPDLSYTPYDLNDYAKRGAIVGASIMERLPEMTSLNKESRGQWWDVTKGISEKDFINWLSGNTAGMSEETLGALNSLKTQVDGIVGDAPESIKNQLIARTLEGAYSSLKESTTQRANANFMTDYQRRQENRQLQNEEKQDSLNAIKYGIQYNEDTKQYEYTPEKQKEIKLDRIKEWVEVGVYPDFETGDPEYNSDGSIRMLTKEEKETMSAKLESTTSSKKDDTGIYKYETPMVFNKGKKKKWRDVGDNEAFKGFNITSLEEISDEDVKNNIIKLYGDNPDRYVIFSKGEDYLVRPRKYQKEDVTKGLSADDLSRIILGLE